MSCSLVAKGRGPRTEINLLPCVVCFCTQSDIYTPMVGVARLREQIEKLTKKDGGNPAQTSELDERESPRGFIHRRMRELDKKKDT